MASAPFVDILICFPGHRAVLGTEALGNIFFPDIFDEIRKLCGFAYGIDHDALPMLC